MSTRQPRTEVIANLLRSTDKEDVYEIDCAGWNVTCVVINRAPDNDRNWLWEWLQGDRTRWKNGSISAILNKVTTKLKRMGIQDQEIEQFESEVIESWLEEIDLSKTSQGQTLLSRGIEQGIEQGGNSRAIEIAKKMINAGRSNDEIATLTELPLDLIWKLKKDSKC